MRTLTGLFRRRPKDPVPLLTRRMRLAEIEVKDRRESATFVRPDGLTAVDPEKAVHEVDRDQAVNAVLVGTRRLLDRASLDEYSSDTLDPVIEKKRIGWDAAVDNGLPGRMHATLQLANQQLEDLTIVAARVAGQREKVTELADAIGNWRRVLLGEVTHLPFPARTHTDQESLAAATQPLPLPLSQPASGSHGSLAAEAQRLMARYFTTQGLVPELTGQPVSDPSAAPEQAASPLHSITEDDPDHRVA